MVSADRFIPMLVLGFVPALCLGVGGRSELERHTRVRDFLEIVGKQPETAQIVRDLALRAGRMGDVAVCRALFLGGAQRFPKRSGWLYHELGEVMSDLGQEEAAIAAYRRALEKREGLRVSYGYRALADLHERRGEIAKAWQVYGELMVDEKALAIHLAEAAAFAKRHALEDAERCFELALEAAEDEGEDSEARVLRKWAGLQRGGEALALYRRLHAGKHTEAADFQKAGILAAELKLEVPCEEFFRQGMRRHPESLGWLQFEFAQELEAFGRLEEALGLYRKAKKDPTGLKVSFAYVGLARLLERLGRPEEARGVDTELLLAEDAMAPHVADAARFEAAQGNVERGLELYLEAFQRAEEDGERIEVGNVLSEGIEHLPALPELTRWFREETEDVPSAERTRLRRAVATTLGNHAWNLLHEGRFSQAATATEMALVIYEPKVLKWVEGNRAHAYLFLGRIEEARSIHERYQGQELELEGFDWEGAAREDFGIFREKGLVTPEVNREMRKLEAYLGIEPAGAG